MIEANLFYAHQINNVRRYFVIRFVTYFNILRLTLSFYIFFFIFKASAQSIDIEGKVIDEKSFKPISNASIKIVGTFYGTKTDSLGNFFLKIPISNTIIEISSLGYEKRSLPITTSTFLVFRLSQKFSELNEILVKPTENTAWAIIRKVLEKKPLNDPQNFDSFQAELYSKVLVKGDFSIKNKKADTLNSRSFNGNFYQLENYGKLYQKNKKRKEVILHSLSTLPSFIPVNSFIDPNINPFGFYQPFILFRLFQSFSSTTPNIERLYVNPINNQFTKQYDFEIKDTLIVDSRARYLIEFMPLFGQKFDGLMGTIQIDTLDFSIVKVNVEPFDSLQITKFKIEQEYRKINDKWYPSKSEIYVSYPILSKNINGRYEATYTTFLRNFSIPIVDENIVFDGTTKVISMFADTISNSFFQQYRFENLSELEQGVYNKWQFDKFPAVKKVLKFIDKPIKAIVSGTLNNRNFTIFNFGTGFNRFEGFKIGLGIQNNYLNNPRFGVQLAGNYSSIIKLGQFLGNSSWFITKNRYNSFQIFYNDYINRPGQVDFLRPNYIIPKTTSFNFRFDSIYVDKIHRYGIALALKPFNFTQVQIRLYNENRKGITYGIFDNENNEVNLGNIEFNVRFAFKETFIRNGYLENVQNLYFPIINFCLKRSIGFDESTYNFLQSSVAIQQQFRIKKVGALNLFFQAGYSLGDIPYTHLFNNLSSGLNYFDVNSGGLNTTSLTNFAYNKYVSIIANHNFGKNLYRSSIKWFQPEFSIGVSMAYSKLNQKHKIEGRFLEDFSNFYPEYSSTIINIFKFKILGGNVGLGVFGSYSNKSDLNQKFRITPRFTFNFL